MRKWNEHGRQKSERSAAENENLPFFLWGVSVRFRTSNIDVEVKLKKARNALLIPKPPIKLKVSGVPVEEVRVVTDRKFVWNGKALATETKFIDPDTKKEVQSSEVLEVLDHYSYKFLDAKGNEVDREKIEYFAVQPDGSEVQVKPFERTDIFDIPEENWVPYTSIEKFRIINVYELYGEKDDIIHQLYEEAERRLKADQVGITTYSFGNGFVQYYAFLVPILCDGKFVWLVKLSDTIDEYAHLTDIPSKVKIPMREVPTLKTLPPVQALIVPTKKKKKE